MPTPSLTPPPASFLSRQAQFPNFAFIDARGLRHLLPCFVRPVEELFPLFFFLFFHFLFWLLLLFPFLPRHKETRIGRSVGVSGGQVLHQGAETYAPDFLRARALSQRLIHQRPIRGTWLGWRWGLGGVRHGQLGSFRAIFLWVRLSRGESKGKQRHFRGSFSIQSHITLGSIEIELPGEVMIETGNLERGL